MLKQKVISSHYQPSPNIYSISNYTQLVLNPISLSHHKYSPLLLLNFTQFYLIFTNDILTTNKNILSQYFHQQNSDSLIQKAIPKLLHQTQNLLYSKFRKISTTNILELLTSNLIILINQNQHINQSQIKQYTQQSTTSSYPSTNTIKSHTNYHTFIFATRSLYYIIFERHMTTFDYHTYAKKMREALSGPNISLAPDYEINHNYFNAKSGHFWSSDDQQNLLKGVNKHGPQEAKKINKEFFENKKLETEIKIRIQLLNYDDKKKKVVQFGKKKADKKATKDE